MGKKILQSIVSAIDIGTTKICVLIATKDIDGKLSLIGIGQHPSYGLKKGVVVNVTKTIESIKQAIAKAEQMAGVKIENVSVGISGGHIKSLNSSGVVAIKNRDVSQEDIDRVIEAAKAVALPENQEILHTFPQYFKIDNEEYILDSIGMHGVRLEAQVHIITGAVSSAQNIIKACEKSGVRVSDIILEQIASADAVLTAAERELGVGILDIGGGTCDFAIYKDGRIIHSKVIPIAGNHFTNDLAIGLSIPIETAEELKKAYGFVWEDKYLELETDRAKIELGYENRTKSIETYSLFDILNPRACEIFEILNDEISKYRLKTFMPSGLVITGGGSLLSGITELAKKTFNMPVRIGLPGCQNEIKHEIPNLLHNPIYATGYGLLLYAAGQNSLKFKGEDNNKSLFAKVFKRMSSWIYEFI